MPHQSVIVLQHSKNIRRAKLAVQNGQHNKAIMALSSEGLAEPYIVYLQWENLDGV